MNPIFVKIREEDFPQRMKNREDRYRISWTRDGKYWVSTDMLTEDDLRSFKNTIRQFLRELKHRRNQK